jgi:hypothetical protein
MWHQGRLVLKEFDHYPIRSTAEPPIRNGLGAGVLLMNNIVRLIRHLSAVGSRAGDCVVGDGPCEIAKC